MLTMVTDLNSMAAQESAVFNAIANGVASTQVVRCSLDTSAMHEVPIGEVSSKPRQSNAKSATIPFDPNAEKDKRLGALAVRKRAR